MAYSGMSVMFWPDLHRKMARKAAQSLHNSNGKDVIKKLNKLFRMPRGPFNSGRFGKQLAESRQALAEHVKSQSMDDPLVQSWLPGVARDQNISTESFTINMLLGLLLKKAGLGYPNFDVISIAVEMVKESRCSRLRSQELSPLILVFLRYLHV